MVYFLYTQYFFVVALTINLIAGLKGNNNFYYDIKRPAMAKKTFGSNQYHNFSLQVGTFWLKIRPVYQHQLF
jgi:hypothetical protein